MKNIKNCLQIGDNDLIGNKFNGHDLHFYLKENNIETKHFVTVKYSNDKDTLLYPPAVSRDEFMSNIIYNPYFLESDIVHLHLIHNTAFDLNYIPVISKLKPLVWTIHDPWAFTGHCVYPFECNKWQFGCQGCEHLDTHFAVSRDICDLSFEMKKNAIQNSQISAIVASKWMKENLEKSPIWTGKKVYHVPFGINQDLFKPVDLSTAKKELDVPEKNFVIFFRSDLSKFKGLDVIKNLLNNLKEIKNITILTVGLKGLINDYKKYFDVKEFGWLKDDEKLVKLYQACDIFLMPSKQEAFGMMAIEAMSCGKTVLALNGTSLPNVIASPECGVAVDENDYVSAFLKLYQNKDLLKEHNKKSLEFAKENYHKNVYVQRMIAVYEDIIKNHNFSDEYKQLTDSLKSNSYYFNELKSFYDKNDYKKCKRKYLKYSFLKKITRGKLQEKYRLRYCELKATVKEMEKFMK